MPVSQKVMQDILDANIEQTAAELGVDRFWVELGSFLIPIVLIVMLFVAIYLVLPKQPTK